MTTVAFLGTGTMGFPMARNLAQAGFDVRAWNRSRDRAEPLREHGVTVCEDPGSAAAQADVLVTMLNDSASVLDVVTRALEGGKVPVWAQMSTIGIEGTDRCAELAQRVGTALVDAPVLGTRDPAEQAKLVVLSSGPREAREACQPLFDAVGQRTLEVGEAGAGTRAKLVVNSWVLGVTALTAETIQVAEALDVDPQVFFDAVEGGPLDLPYSRLKGAAMIARAFDDAAFKLVLARKDADLVIAAAQQEAIDSPVLRAVAERFRRAEESGHGEEDMAANFLATAGD